jgi:hypothetical protein
VVIDGLYKWDKSEQPGELPVRIDAAEAPGPAAPAVGQTRIGEPPASQVMADFVNRWAALGSRFASHWD